MENAGLIYKGPEKLEKIVEFVYSKTKENYKQQSHHIFVKPFLKKVDSDYVGDKSYLYYASQLEKIINMLYNRGEDEDRAKKDSLYNYIFNSLCELCGYNAGNGIIADIKAVKEIEKMVVGYYYDAENNSIIFNPIIVYILADAIKSDDNNNKREAFLDFAKAMKSCLAMADVYFLSKFTTEPKRLEEEIKELNNKIKQLDEKYTQYGKKADDLIKENNSLANKLNSSYAKNVAEICSSDKWTNKEIGTAIEFGKIKSEKIAFSEWFRVALNSPNLDDNIKKYMNDYLNDVARYDARYDEINVESAHINKILREIENEKGNIGKKILNIENIENSNRLFVNISDARRFLIAAQYAMLEKQLPEAIAEVNFDKNDFNKKTMESILNAAKGFFEKVGKKEENYCAVLTRILDMSYEKKMPIKAILKLQ